MKLVKKPLGWRDFYAGRWRISFQFRRSCSGGFSRDYHGWSYGGWIGAILATKQTHG